MRYYHYGKPHRSLTQKEHDTRFPGILRDRYWKSLRHLSKRFTLDAYMDSKWHLNLPLAKGKITFVRKVDSQGRVEISDAQYFIRRKLEGQYIVATIFTRRKKLVIKHEKQLWFKTTWLRVNTS